MVCASARSLVLAVLRVLGVLGGLLGRVGVGGRLLELLLCGLQLGLGDRDALLLRRLLFTFGAVLPLDVDRHRGGAGLLGRLLEDQAARLLRGLLLGLVVLRGAARP